MADRVEVVGLLDGEVMSNMDEKGAREVVLALPLSRLLVRMVRVPSEQESDVSGYLTPILQEMSPYPDEPLQVGWETVLEGENGRVVLAAALPESSADDIAEILDAQKLRVTRLDALLLGELRALWPAIAAEGDLGKERRLVLIGGVGGEGAAETGNGGEGAAETAPVKASGLEMVVLDGDMPSAIRAIPEGADLKRETMLCLLEAEDFGGAKPLAEIVTVGSVRAEAFAAFAPVRPVTPVSILDSLEAIAARSGDAGALDARPASWREFLDETRFKAKLARGVAAAVGVWLLAMGVLFGVPMTYGYMTDYQKGLSKQHQRAYKEVKDTKAKFELVRKYSDHTRGALEMMKAISDRLPAGVELESWDFKRGDDKRDDGSRDGGVTFAGIADDPKPVYTLKDELAALADADGNAVFGHVRFVGGGLRSAKGDKQKFTIECKYEAEEDAE